MKKFDIGIRVDMGETIGSGHFFRCLSIARELKRNNKTVIFLTSDKNAFKKHMKEKIPYKILTGNTEKKKIQECKKIMNNIKVLIIDLPSYGKKYGKELENENVILINDLGNMEVFSKILINGSIVKKFHKYKIQNEDSKLYLNSKYMIIRKEFLKEKNAVRIHQKPIKNILITFGGSAENNITKKLLKILPINNFNITIILGPGSKEKDIFDSIKNDGKIKWITNPQNITKLFAKQDLIISSTGITIYELAYLGIPTLMVPITSPQNETAKEMERRGFGKIIDLHKISLKQMQNILVKFEDHKFRRDMHRSGKKIIDGKGTTRVVKIIEDSIKN